MVKALCIASSSANTPLLFSTDEVMGNSKSTDKGGNAARQVVKYIDKPARKITEIRVYYDDQTWESFAPGKS